MHDLRVLPLLAAALFASACAAPHYTSVARPKLDVPDDVVHAEGSFVSADGLKLYEQSWLPKGPARAAVVLVHGLKDHSNHYGEVADRLVAKGLAVYAFDLRGHGSSEGDRVYVRSFDEYLSDLDVFMKSVRAREPGKPVFLFGHSMGGAIVTLYTIRQKPELKGLVLSGPALKPGADINGFLIGVTKFLGAVTPTLAVFSLPDEKFSRDPKVIEAMKNDPLIYQGNGPAKTAAKLLGAMQEIGEHMEEVTVPLFVMHGGEDVVTNPEGSKELIQRAQSKDKTLQIYEGLYHDLVHEPEKERVIGDLVNWIDRRAPAVDESQAAPMK